MRKYFRCWKYAAAAVIISMITLKTHATAYYDTTSKGIYNTVLNPEGSKVISIWLSDGTKVWLNSGSSVKYPVAFSGSERKVEITGEVYFEVAKNAKKKFYVSTSRVAIEVSDARFNVNNYKNEGAIKITVLEGNLKVRNNSSSAIIKPGQQAKVNATITVENGVDLEQVLSWKSDTQK